MTFDYALSLIRKYGGHMRKSTSPTIEFFISDSTLYLIYFDQEENENKIGEASLYGSELMSDDWEVNILGSFVND